jgi:heme-degrading monooxygenase HmoA
MRNMSVAPPVAAGQPRSKLGRAQWLGVHGGFGMVVRIWHGWTSPQDAEPYETLLREEIFVGIADRSIEGFLGIKLLRRQLPSEVEFVTIMSFRDLDAVREFAGTDYELAVVPPEARKLLARFDDSSQHYELRLEHA